MISEFVREQKRYTQNDICKIMHCREDKAVPLIRKLKEFGLLKTVKASDQQRDMSDLLDEDIEVADVEEGVDEYLYVFTFVGVIVVSGCVLKCYPKYLLHATAPKDEMKQVLKVLEKYNSKEQIVRMFNDSSESSAFNLLAVLLFLIQDYYENGVYSNTEDVIESNGSGEILWDKTINETFTLLSENRPYYIELQTKKRVTNEYDFFKRLHECILTKASKELKNAELLELFEITEIDLTDEELDDFGETEYVLYRIEKELNVQFNTRKQMVLKTMYAYIAHNGNLYDIDCLSLFGTTSFNLVWEKVCAEVFDNKLDTTLGQLKMHVPLSGEFKDQRKKRLIDIIEKPIWESEDTTQTAKDTLIPDLISMPSVGGVDYFVILDAKYYLLELEKGKSLRGNPGVGDVTKQYLYQLAYRKFVKAHGINVIRNCFVMPTENDRIIKKGVARMPMLEAMGLENIQIRQLPAAQMYACYLSQRKMDIRCLDL